MVRCEIIENGYCIIPHYLSSIPVNWLDKPCELNSTIVLCLYLYYGIPHCIIVTNSIETNPSHRPELRHRKGIPTPTQPLFDHCSKTTSGFPKVDFPYRTAFAEKAVFSELKQFHRTVDVWHRTEVQNYLSVFSSCIKIQRWGPSDIDESRRSGTGSSDDGRATKMHGI